ncbi:uncharacterized protein K441DRAFT_672210 [Cenococcum geophilum 1.58]|uniref:Uncharacterized protein n=1 Tax=Cenococcum geophilum 1.58 TaxID=794803 RepID=A0ACC8EJY9_9PEZI|nr:hypothetical protein K441DRAFT_672210 [Cenococcum geophilum 1.58]
MLLRSSFAIWRCTALSTFLLSLASRLATCWAFLAFLSRLSWSSRASFSACTT